MSGQVSSTGFVPVDAVFSEEGADLLQLSAGERLRDLRIKAGLTLDSAAARTRIRRDYLEAIETMDPRGLPARAYTIGYLRTYASFLGLEADAIVEQFKREVDTDTGRARPTAATKTRKDIRLPRGAFGAVLILVSVVAIGWWYLQQVQDGSEFLGVPAPPDAIPDWAMDDFSDEPVRASVAEIWDELPVSEPLTSSELVLRALSPTWLEVRDRSGRILFARDLEAGEIYRALEAGLQVSTANAGAIALERDGAAVGRLGEEGQALENQPLPGTPSDVAEAPTEG
ncbi:helix-turn-helix domain-containing protein [Maricaulis sp. D1M11]|uniref:helix-turn-helix domain-containing protein n=1 Tax=Maricaulis sp. D1M11 TaxID=3076117 RepID=UPI0039B6000F